MTRSILETVVPAPKARSPVRARPGALLVAGWLTVTAPLVLTAGLAVGAPLLAAHLVLAVTLARLARTARPGAVGVLADWLPLLLVPVLYWELPVLMDALPGPVCYHDPWVAGLEAGLFGGQPAFTWAGAWPWTVLSELLHACYVSFYPLIYVPPFLLYRRAGTGDGTLPEGSAAFHDTVFALLLCFLVCFAVFVVFPVQGPRYLGVPTGVPDGPVRSLVLTILDGASSRGAAFPSSHVAVAVTQGVVALRYQPRVGRWVLAIAVGLGAGAVYGGFHYAVDAVVGAAAGVLVARAARGLGRAG